MMTLTGSASARSRVTVSCLLSIPLCSPRKGWLASLLLVFCHTFSYGPFFCFQLMHASEIYFLHLFSQSAKTYLRCEQGAQERECCLDLLLVARGLVSPRPPFRPASHFSFHENAPLADDAANLDE